MPQLYQTKIWQAQLPDGWKVWKTLFHSATFFKPDGIGQIFVHVGRPESELPKNHPANNERFFGTLHGSTATSTGGGLFRRYWLLSCGNRTLRVSYSCASSFAEVERHEVDDILQSMAESDAPAE